MDEQVEFTGVMTGEHGWSQTPEGGMTFFVKVTAPDSNGHPVFLVEMARQIAEELCRQMGVADDRSNIKISGSLVDLNKDKH